MLALLAFSACGGGTKSSTGDPNNAASAAGPAGSETAADETVDEAQANTAEAGAEELPMLDFRNATRAHGYLVGGALTPEHVVEAREKGYTRIIDLRQESEDGVAEERAKAEEIGIRYISLPIGGPTDLTEQKTEAFADLLAEDDGPTIVHCRSGNRVGALFALRAYLIEKKPAEEALQVGLDAGLTKLEGHIRSMLGLD